MPIYEFKCENCSAITEEWQKVSDPYPTECPVCKNGKLTKLISPSGFVLKGSGWYATDFKNKSTSSTSAETPKSDAPAASSSAASSSSSDS